MKNSIWGSSKINFRYANGEILTLFRKKTPHGDVIGKFTFKEILHDRLSGGERICIEKYFEVHVSLIDPATYMFLRPGMKVQLLLKERKFRRVSRKIRKYGSAVSLVDLMVFDIANIVNDYRIPISAA